MNVFEEVKRSITARQAAEYYGIRVGRNGMAFCPFHDDRHPSMKVDRRFLPVAVDPEQAEVHILEDEKASRAYIDQMWAEIMAEYRKENVQLSLSRETEEYIRERQKEFMPEDTLSVRILNFLDGYMGDKVCSLQLYYEALGHSSWEEPKQYEIRDINSVMNNYAAGWTRFDSPRHFPPPYGRQKGWERQRALGNGDGFSPLPEGAAEQMSLPEEWFGN